MQVPEEREGDRKGQEVGYGAGDAQGFADFDDVLALGVPVHLELPDGLGLDGRAVEEEGEEEGNGPEGFVGAHDVKHNGEGPADEDAFVEAQDGAAGAAEDEDVEVGEEELDL